MTDTTLSLPSNGSSEPSSIRRRMENYRGAGYYTKFEIWFTENERFMRWGPLLLSPLLAFVFGLLSVAFESNSKPAWFFVGLSVIYAAIAIKPVSDKKEPKRALLLLNDKRLPIMFSGGWVVTIPLVTSLMEFVISKQNIDWEFPNIRCRLLSVTTNVLNNFLGHIAKALTQRAAEAPGSGGEVEYDTGSTFQVRAKTAWDLIELDDAGGFEKALSIIHDRVGNFLRTLARRVTWLEATLTNDVIAMLVMLMLAGERLIDHGLEDVTEDDINRFMSRAFIHGVEIEGTGVDVQRIDIKRVIPEDGLADAAKLAAIELLREAGILRNAHALRKAAEYIRGGDTGRKVGDKSISLAAALDAALVNDPDAKVSRTIEQKNYGLDPAILAALKTLFGKDK